jgi:hypothetical protein
MVRKIQIEALRECPEKEWLGRWPDRSDINEIIHEDVDVYLPSGELAIVFRVGALKSTLPVSKGGTLTDENYKYWKWVSKRPPGTDQRGFAAGKEILTFPEARLTIGQWNFFLKATRENDPVIDEQEARQIIDENTSLSRNTYYLNKVESDGLVDMEEIEKWHSLVMKKTIQGEERKEATAKRNKAKLAWFENWFNTVWVPSKDRVATARAGKKRYITIQPRGNMVFSSILGIMDRSGRLPYGRLTAFTEKKPKEFEENVPFYREVNKVFSETLPDKFKVLNDRFSQVKDEKYNLFGTAFTTITVNYNFQVAYHRDGNNAQGAVAALAVMESGDWSGGEFVFPELGIGFEIRAGDIFVGDNQGLIHGMLPFNHSDMCWGNYGHESSADHIFFVFYQRDRVVQLDDLKCEGCRKSFMEHNIIHNQHKGTGEPKWTGSWAGMWTSPEWTAYKTKEKMEHCSDTNYWCT